MLIIKIVTPGREPGRSLSRVKAYGEPDEVTLVEKQATNLRAFQFSKARF